MGHQEELAKLEAELNGPEVDDFLAFLRLKGLAQRTLVEYLRILRLLRQHLQGTSKPFSQVTVEELRSFIAKSQAQELSSRTVSNRVVILKRFFGFLLAEGYLTVDPMQRLPMPKKSQRLPKALTKEQVQQLFTQLGETPLFRFRDKVIVTLMYTCGVRISETVGLRRDQLDLAQGILRVMGKGSKERRLFLRPEVVQLLERYLAELGESDYLFPSPRGGHITQNHIQIEVGKYAQKAGLPEGVTAHTLRHTCATHYLLGGAPITFVQRMLGHADLKTTGLYTGLVDETAREIALNTPLAFDEKAEDWRGRLLKEPEPGYVAWTFVETADYVDNVMIWLAD